LGDLPLGSGLGRAHRLKKLADLKLEALSFSRTKTVAQQTCIPAIWLLISRQGSVGH
jgi:hypothetical protein